MAGSGKHIHELLGREPSFGQDQFDMSRQQILDHLQTQNQFQPQKRGTNRFLATIPPVSISAHPDHHLYPSYKLLGPGLIASRSLDPRQQQDLDTQSVAPKRPQMMHAQFSPDRVPSLGSLENQSVSPGSGPAMPDTLPSQSSPFLSDSVAPNVRLMASFPMPLPPHPAANYLPFLEPMLSSRKAKLKQKASVFEYTATESLPRRRSGVAEPTQKPRDDHVKSAHAGFKPCTPHEAMLRASTTFLDWPCSASSPTFTAGSMQPQHADAGVSLHNMSHSNRTYTYDYGSQIPVQTFTERHPASILPYGRGSPAIMFLKKAPFVSCVRQLLAAALIYDSSDGEELTIDNEERHEPAWQQAYLRIGGIRYAQALSIRPLQYMSMAESAFTHTAWAHAPDEFLLSNYVQTFSAHIQSICPIIAIGNLEGVVSEFLRHSNTLEHQERQRASDLLHVQVEYAIEMLVFALGSVCWAKCGGPIIEPGPEFYARAKGILELFADENRVKTAVGSFENLNNNGEYNFERYSAYTNETTIDLARAHLLAALFCGQLAWVFEAAQHVRDASSAIMYLIHQPSSGSFSDMAQDTRGPSLVEYAFHPHTLSHEERQLVLLYWICVFLEFEINAEVCTQPSPLLHYQSTIPPPIFDESPIETAMRNDEDTAMTDADPSRSINSGIAGRDMKQERDVRTNFEAQVCLRSHLNRIYVETFCGQTEARSAVEELQLQFQGLSISQPQPSSVWKSTLTARARAGYWEGVAWGFLPVLEQAYEQADPADLTAGVCSLAEVIRAYHGVAEGRLILPNSFGAAMMYVGQYILPSTARKLIDRQCRYLLLLFAASRAMPTVAEIATDAMLGELIEGTAISLQEMAGPPGVLQSARRVLRVMQQQLQAGAKPAPMIDEADSVAVAVADVPEGQVYVPGLSLFCPPFSFFADSGGALATATTSASFTSLPTPNTASCWSSGTSPIPHTLSSPLGSPNSSLASPLASSVPAVSSYTLGAKGSLGPSPWLPTSAVHPLWQLPGAVQTVSEPSFCFADILAFSYQLGLSHPFDSPGELW